MVWILLVLSTGAYNSGSVTGIEFNTQKACVDARLELANKDEKATTRSMCVKKGEQQ